MPFSTIWGSDGQTDRQTRLGGICEGCGNLKEEGNRNKGDHIHGSCYPTLGANGGEKEEGVGVEC